MAVLIFKNLLFLMLIFDYFIITYNIYLG